MRLKLLLASTAALVALTSCTSADSAPTTGPPPPATEEEMEAFCAAYDEVRSQSFGEITAALVEVSPAEIQDQMIRTSQPPGDGWLEDRTAVEEFLDRCDSPTTP